MHWQTHFRRAAVALCVLSTSWAQSSVNAQDPEGEPSVVVGVPAGIDAIDDQLFEAVIWGGRSPTTSESLRVSAASAEINGEAVFFGCLHDSEGIAMAFVDSSDDRPLISVLWHPMEDFSSRMVSLWSDGLCQFIEVRRRNAGHFGDRVPWLSAAVPPVPRGFLKAPEGVQDPFLQDAAREFSRFTISDEPESAGPERWVVRETSEIPEFFDERLGAIESRFFELRDCMEGVAAAVAGLAPGN